MKTVKTLFIWLLLSFIPLQGIAANALLVCKATNQRLPLQAIQGGEKHTHPCAEFNRAPALQNESHDKHQKVDATCVAQYAGIPWMPVSEIVLPPFGVLSDPISYIGFYIMSFIPEGPERPPRSLSL